MWEHHLDKISTRRISGWGAKMSTTHFARHGFNLWWGWICFYRRLITNPCLHIAWWLLWQCCLNSPATKKPSLQHPLMDPHSNGNFSLYQHCYRLTNVNDIYIHMLLFQQHTANSPLITLSYCWTANKYYISLMTKCFFLTQFNKLWFTIQGVLDWCKIRTLGTPVQKISSTTDGAAWT